MVRRKEFLILAAIGLVMVAGLASVLSWHAMGHFSNFDGLHPSDEKLVRDFQDNKQKFVELLGMYQAADGLVQDYESLANGGQQPDLKSDEVTDPTLKQYLRLREDLNIDSIQETATGQVLFITSSHEPENKGYAFSDNAPAPVVGNTQSDAAQYAYAGSPTTATFRLIQDKWYVYYEW